MLRRIIACDLSHCMVFATANGGNDEVHHVIATSSLEYYPNNDLLQGGSGIINAGAGTPSINNLAAVRDLTI